MATYCRHPYIQLCARSSVSLRSGGSILQSKAGPFLASGEGLKDSTLHINRVSPLIPLQVSPVLTLIISFARYLVQ
jgi:hypothetical protein